MRKKFHTLVKLCSWILLFYTILLFMGYVFRWNWILFPGHYDSSIMKIQHEIIGQYAIACCSICILFKVICVQFDLYEIKRILGKDHK